MKDIRFDQDGTERCWNCGGKSFNEQRTAKSKVMFGVGALLTSKKLKCRRCGEYSDVGSGKAYDGPADKRYQQEWIAEQARTGKLAPAGWFPNPDGDGRQRYWDGTTWTEHYAPAPSSLAPPTPNA